MSNAAQIEYAARVWRGCFAIIVAAVGCRDVLGIEELARGVPDTGVDATSCAQNLATGTCHSCLASSCCAEIEACNGDETCRRSLGCVLQCAGGDEVCAAKCVIRFGEKLANVLSCRARSCADACGTTCGGTFGAVRPKHIATNPACAECYRAAACDQNTACARDALCLRELGCAWSCPLLDRSCNAQCRFPLGQQPGSDNVQGAMARCRTDCREGVDWTCVDTSKYANGAATGKVGFHVRLLDATEPSKPFKGVTMRPCFDSLCERPAGTKCLSDETGYCAGEVEVTAPGSVFRGIVEATGEDVYPTLYFVHPLLTGAWPGNKAYTPNTALVVSKTSFSLIGALLRVDPIPGRGHIAVGIFDCLWSPASGLTVSVSRSDDKTALRYVSGGLPSPDATMTDVAGTAYVINVEPSGAPLTLTARAGDRVVAEVPVYVRADTISFGLVGPR